MTLDLGARGLAHTALMEPDRSTILVLLGPGEPAHRLLDAVRIETPDEHVAKLSRSAGNTRLELTNGTRIIFQSVSREGRGITARIVALTHDARRALNARHFDLSGLLATGAELAEL